MTPCICTEPGYCPAYERVQTPYHHRVCRGSPSDGESILPEKTAAYRRRWEADSAIARARHPVPPGPSRTVSPTPVREFTRDFNLTLYVIPETGDENHKNRHGGWAHPSWYFWKPPVPE